MNNLTLPFQIKSLSDEGHIHGLISAFGKVDSYGDTVAPGAYAKSLARIAASGRRLPLLYQHDVHRPIGVWTELKETPEGLVGSAQLTMGTRDAQEAHALARDGALTGISIGYRVPTGGSRDVGGVQHLSEIDLREASLVTFPADDHARVRAVKAIASARDIAELLREGGLSGRQAKAAAGAAWKAINESEPDDGADQAIAALFSASAARVAAL